MKNSAFIWRVRLSLLLLAFGSLIVERDQGGTTVQPAKVEGGSSAVMAVDAVRGRHAESDRSLRGREQLPQVPVADHQIKAAITPGSLSLSLPSLAGR